MRVLHADTRRPGIRVERRPPVLAEPLPRMDIAVFVGFAESGPLHIPVVVESEEEFRTIFGRDVPLAWDRQAGQQRYGFLKPTVRTFFRNGGQRCWIIRVAGEAAKRNHAPIPGLLALSLSADRNGRRKISPTFALARSEGSWADSLELRTTILSELIQIRHVSTDEREGLLLQCEPDVGKVPKSHDLLRLTFAEEEAVAYVAIKSVEVRPASTLSPPDSAGATYLHSGQLVWMRTSFVTSPSGLQSPAMAALISKNAPSMGDPRPATIHWPDASASSELMVDLEVPFSEAPQVGTLVRLDVEDAEIWLSIRTVKPKEDDGSPIQDWVRITGSAIQHIADPPSAIVASMQSGGIGPIRSEILTLTLDVTNDKQDSWHLSDLGFSPSHPRLWDALPSDEERYGMVLPWEVPNKHPRVSEETTELWNEVRASVFPLSASHQMDVLYIPFLETGLPQRSRPIIPDGLALERNGLAEFDADLFLDPDLKDSSVSSLIAQSEQLQFLGSTTRPLKGIHAAMPVEEASLIAVPDAVHLSWTKSEGDGEIEVPVVSEPPIRPEWWHFLPCDPQPDYKAVAEPPGGYFIACDADAPPAPTLVGEEEQSGSIQLSWSNGGEVFVLEESVVPDFSDAIVVYRGSETSATLYGRTHSVYYFRVRAELNGKISNWSNGVVVRRALAGSYELDQVALQSREGGDTSVGLATLKDPLVKIHEALIRMCAARGDLFAVLSVPDWFRESDTTLHASGLTNRLNRPYREQAVTSYAALYYPWTVIQDDDLGANLTSIPPDGAICGVMAASALTRGAWIAPANQIFRDMMALMPSVAEEREIELQQVHVNLLSRQPSGFLVFSEDTLSDDAELRLINVRRLLMLIRRIAVRVGARYVFEPHNDVFRRAVQRGFERVCEDLFERGAFSGATRASSYQVVVGESNNPPQSVDQGRLFVEIRVAPSEPLRFLTVRLVEAGDRGFIVQGR